LRDESSDEEIAQWLRDVVWQKEAGHRIGKEDFVAPARSMSCIGG
jgi:cyclic pyranopterin phosphate synthase